MKFGAEELTTAASVAAAIVAAITSVAITSIVTTITSISFAVAAVAASACLIRVDAARRLNDFGNGHHRLVSVDKNDTSSRIATLIDRELWFFQPCSDCVDADFGAQKPLTSLKVVNGVLFGKLKYAPVSGHPHPSASDKYRSDTAFQNQPRHFLAVLVLHHDQRFLFLKYSGID